MAAKTLEPAVYQFIQRYEEVIGDKPTAEQALLLKYFKEAGNELPIYNGRGWFYTAWRKVDILPMRAMASRDMVVWHLVAFDPAIDAVVMELLPEGDPYAV
ncbi:hypothetical protein CTA21_16415 [Salmonella enterica]|nr:hypothetical protein [Salmonella enterica]EDZ0839879.1 hypothetical protein [Salmonella enterica subsp. enterica serovar Saintpaul]EEC1303330.1 hypothetical protein [Salmonella enterica]